MTHDDALAILRERLSCIVGAETVPLEHAAGRLAAEAVHAPCPVPATDNAAVDGYAFAHADYVARDGRLTVAMHVAAGHAPQISLASGKAARIFTGAAMPGGADSVVMQEDVTLDGDRVSIPPGLGHGANCRQAGEDLRTGDMVLGAGLRLRPQDLAALASIGRGSVSCRAPLKVAIASTGDEIVRPGSPIRPGQVHDANHYLLRALLAPLGAEITDLGILPDDASLVERALADAAGAHNAIVTSGGAGGGDKDHLAAALGRLGARHLWHMAVKPGRPMSFGAIGDCAVFALPGNPVASMVSFLLYARPALLTLSGARWQEPRRFAAIADFALPDKKAGRREFLRGTLAPGLPPRVTKYPRDGSGLISSLRAADGLIELAEAVTCVAEGEPVAFIPFTEFGILR